MAPAVYNVFLLWLLAFGLFISHPICIYMRMLCLNYQMMTRCVMLVSLSIWYDTSKIHASTTMHTFTATVHTMYIVLFGRRCIFSDQSQLVAVRSLRQAANAQSQDSSLVTSRTSNSRFAINKPHPKQQTSLERSSTHSTCRHAPVTIRLRRCYPVPDGTIPVVALCKGRPGTFTKPILVADHRKCTNKLSGISIRHLFRH